MYTGYDYSTRSGSSIGVNDFVIPQEKAGLIKAADDEVAEIENQFNAGSSNPGREVQQGNRYLVQS